MFRFQSTLQKNASRFCCKRLAKRKKYVSIKFTLVIQYYSNHLLRHRRSIYHLYSLMMSLCKKATTTTTATCMYDNSCASIICGFEKTTHLITLSAAHNFFCCSKHSININSSQQNLILRCLCMRILSTHIQNDKRFGISI